MGNLDFESQLQSSIASVYYEVEYVAYYIGKAQSLYNSGNDSEARECLESAVDLLRAAGEDWAANKVEYYERFM